MNVPVASTSALFGRGEADVELRTPRGLTALYQMLGDHTAVHDVVSNYRNWGQLAAAPRQSLVALLGSRAATLAVPAKCPPLPATRPGTTVFSRYALDYPPAVRAAPDPPCLLTIRGQLPSGDMVAVGGAARPSPSGVEIARSAALACAAQRRPVVVVADGVCSSTALRSTVEAGGRAVVILTAGIDMPRRDAGLLEEVLALGGAWVTEAPAGAASSPVFAAGAPRLAVALARAVVLAEVGRHESSGRVFASAAVAAGRYLIVPTVQVYYTPDSAAGLQVLISAKEFRDEWYGSNARVQSRVAEGLSPADAVVTTQAEIGAAISAACGQQT